MAQYVSPAEAIRGLTRAVTKDWTKQRKAEERNSSAVGNRSTRLIKSQQTTIKDAAFRVMDEAYDKASAGGKLPANPRQVYYAARRHILLATGNDSLQSGYFLQTLLPSYMEAYDCSHWDLIWDARGNFREPHTGIVIPIGTLQVREYVGERPKLGNPVKINPNAFFPTKGPEHRYKYVMFVEKEGFDPILEASQVANRYDIGFMSTKGLSTTAARLLLDRLVKLGVEKVLVLHDLDIAGFSIIGTLGTNSSRYTFENKVPIIDIGLRLTDVERLGLLSEPFTEPRKNRVPTAATLKRHGATEREVKFLIQKTTKTGFSGERVELNALTSGEFIDFIERKFTEHGIRKLIPETEILEQHARRMLEQRMVLRQLGKLTPEFRDLAATAKLPDGLQDSVRKLLDQHPERSWDQAIAAIIEEHESSPPPPPASETVSERLLRLKREGKI